MSYSMNNPQIDAERLAGLEREVRDLRRVFERIYVLMWWSAVGFFGVVGLVVSWYIYAVNLFPVYLTVAAVVAVGFALRWLFNLVDAAHREEQALSNGVAPTSTSHGA